MSISPLPPAPQTTDPANFDARADALIAALPTFINECNATAAAMDFNDTNGTSSTSVLISVASKTFTASTGKSWQLGMTLRIASTASPTNFMTGEVTAYNSGTGALTVNVTNTSGSGTLAAWTISQAGVSLQAPVLDLTGYSGADVSLGIGQSAIYDVVAVTSLSLRIASAQGKYKITGDFVPQAASATGGAVLSPNNAVQANIDHMTANMGHSPANSFLTNWQTAQGNYILSAIGSTLRHFVAEVCTITAEKNCSARCKSLGSTSTSITLIESTWNDGVVHTSLGTLSLQNTGGMTGRILVQRIM